MVPILLFFLRAVRVAPNTTPGNVAAEVGRIARPAHVLLDKDVSSARQKLILGARNHLDQTTKQTLDRPAGNVNVNSRL